MKIPAEVLHGKILIVDDQAANVLLLERVLGGAGYRSVSSTTDPTAVCALHHLNQYDLILLDIQMPVMDGFQVLEGLKTVEDESYLPVLVITAEPSHKMLALEAGARHFISKPFDLAEVLVRVRNMLEVRMLQKSMQHFNESLEHRVTTRTAELQESYLETIFTMTRAAEYRDDDTGSHVKRISYYSRALAIQLGHDAQFVDSIFIASPMHDIGKIGIPDSILLKPGGLSPDEWTVMKSHAEIGEKILGKSKSKYLKLGAQIALNHHERWDGSGYPKGKRGEEIPMAARIMNICDIYDALRSARVYKPAFDHEKAVHIITVGDGSTKPEHFDPVVLAAFKAHHELFAEIFDQCDDEISF